MINMKTVFLLVILLFIPVSCAKNDSDAQDLPGITISTQDMNTAFVIEDLPVKNNSHENTKRLALVLRNLSDKTIVFPTDYGIKIFIFQNQAWNLVHNNFLYTGEENVLPTAEEFPPGLMVISYPNIPDLQEPVSIRIIIIGHYEGSDTEVVGAYIDIPLLP